MMLPTVHNTDCVFCRIAAGTAGAEVLLRTPRTMAILDINPIHQGHALVIPRAHYQDFLSIPAEELGELTRAAQAVAGTLVRVLGLEGFNVFSNNGRIAGQSVFHAHIHVTPRYAGDGIRFVPILTAYGPGEKERMAVRLRADLDAHRTTQGE